MLNLISGLPIGEKLVDKLIPDQAKQRALKELKDGARRKSQAHGG